MLGGSEEEEARRRRGHLCSYDFERTTARPRLAPSLPRSPAPCSPGTLPPPLPPARAPARAPARQFNCRASRAGSSAGALQPWADALNARRWTRVASWCGVRLTRSWHAPASVARLARAHACCSTQRGPPPHWVPHHARRMPPGLLGGTGPGEPNTARRPLPRWGWPRSPPPALRRQAGRAAAGGGAEAAARWGRWPVLCSGLPRCASPRAPGGLPHLLLLLPAQAGCHEWMA
jgi:hypothetical protein